MLRRAVLFPIAFTVAAVIVCSAVTATPPAEPESIEPTAKNWNGYRRYDLRADGRAVTIVEPHVADDVRPWIWRARFFGHEPQTDLSLLSRGWHVVYMDVAELFGNPQAVAHWDAMYAYATEELKLSKKAVLEGMSRGGLIVYNWAAKNPEKVACIYADAPVLDFKSWPGGKGSGKGSPPDWEKCKAAYGLSEEEALAYDLNPLDQLEPLAKAGVPLLHVCGAADEVVPVAENTAILEKRYRALGGDITVILKEGVGHHPHSLEDPQPIVDFILANTVGENVYYRLRGTMGNAAAQFRETGKGRVAFLGGSITEMKGWRDLVQDELRHRFPDTEFEFIDAGISSTDSTLAAFRLTTDVFKNGPVDLLFAEHAVNDNHNQRDQIERIRGVEGVIRQALTLNPRIDIVVQYFVEPDKMDYFNAGQPSPVIVDHERVCQHYNVTVNNLAREVTDRINRGEFSWDKDFKDLHPSPFGHEVYMKSIARLLDAAEANPVTGPRTVPAPLDAHSYGHGHYVALEKAKLQKGWTLVPSWNSVDKAGKRKRFVNVPTLEALEPGAELKLTFEGTAVGLLVTAGPDVGVIEWTVDNGAPKRLDQFTEWSEGLHIPWAYMLETELDPGPHVLTLRTTDDKNDESVGHACRIIQFLVNGP